jgi:hypothetical protein
MKSLTSEARTQATEDPAAVCARLGIDGDTYRSLRWMLANQLRGGLEAVRRALECGDVHTAGLRLEALRRAGANLGATALVSRIRSIEAALSSEAWAHIQPPPRVESRVFLQSTELLRSLDGLEAEARRFGPDGPTAS